MKLQGENMKLQKENINNFSKLDSLKFAFACAYTFGLIVLTLGLLATFFGFWQIVDYVGIIYYGYEPTFVGSLIGAACGFIQAFVPGYLIATIYNKSLQS